MRAIERSIEIDAGKLGLKVACPFLPSNVKNVEEVKNIAIDQAVIGSCTNGRLEDLEIAAEILYGKKVAKHVRCIIIPATPDIYHAALTRGYFETYLDAGCIISPPCAVPALAATWASWPGRKGRFDDEQKFRGNNGPSRKRGDPSQGRPLRQRAR